jgi:hypothetical protein
LLSEPADSELIGPGDNASLSGALSLRQQVLLLIGSGLVSANNFSSEHLQRRLTAACTDSTGMVSLAAQGIPAAFVGLPRPIATALAAAISCPMFQVVSSHAANEDSSSGASDHRRGVSRGPAASNLARVVSIVGNDAAEASLLTSAVALGLVAADVALPTLSSLSTSGTHTANGSNVRRSGPHSIHTGRYGDMLRRREELQMLIFDTVREHSGEVVNDQSASKL